MTRPPTELVEECRTIRQHLLDAATYIWRDDSWIKQLLADIRRGSGYVDTADDLQRLSDLFRSRWAEAEGRSDVTRKDADRGSELSTSLLKAAASPLTEEISTWADLRQRAWTWLSNSYKEIRAGAAYIHRDNPERLADYPSFYAHPRKDRK